MPSNRGKSVDKRTQNKSMNKGNIARGALVALRTSGRIKIETTKVEIENKYMAGVVGSPGNITFNNSASTASLEAIYNVLIREEAIQEPNRQAFH